MFNTSTPGSVVGKSFEIFFEIWIREITLLHPLGSSIPNINKNFNHKFWKYYSKIPIIHQTFNKNYIGKLTSPFIFKYPMMPELSKISAENSQKFLKSYNHRDDRIAALHKIT